ncbi:MAG: ABC transporter ATP-binding protein [Candidatus Sumerlaeia bacterium]
MLSEDHVLSIRNVSKCYHIYREKHHRLLQALTGDRKKYYKEFWALRDISFDVRRGECVGIIGRNGSGKSTLLQIVAGTLTPTRGELEIRGRVAALLELGSGFNPEFTGRENVYLNGTVLGLAPARIDAKFDEIAAFADIGEFIEQPIKTYSSGMVVRLAYAVQALVEPEFLIVDEALSVGDAAFQMKCMAHMQRLMDRGTTILIVSHSVQTIRTYCGRAIWLDRGRVREAGPAPEVTSQYVEFLFAGSTSRPEEVKAVTDQPAPTDQLMALEYPGRKDPLRRWGSGEIQVTHFSVSGDRSGNTPVFQHLENIRIRFRAAVRQGLAADVIAVAAALRDIRGIDVIAVSSAEHKLYWTSLEPGEIVDASFEFENIVNPGEYMLIVAVEYFVEGKRKYCDYVENAFLIQTVSEHRHFGVVEPRVQININKSQAGCPA